MLAPSTFHFSNVDQLLLSTGTATKLLSACLLGGAIGMEREWRHKASGLRTNMLMCMACALFTLLSVALAGDSTPNKGQVAANIVQGVGFLGAGLILHTRSRVLGLTSASTVFVVAAIGMACGAGLYLEALIATVIVLIALRTIGYMEFMMPWKQYVLLYEVRGREESSMFAAILSVLDQAKLRLNLVERDTLGDLQRVTFAVSANRLRHKELLRELEASDRTDKATAFPDADAE